MTDDKTAWRVFKLMEDDPRDPDPGLPMWEECGEIDAQWTYCSPSVEDLGKAYGAGTFLLISSEARNVETKTIVARQSYEELDEERAAV